jgi:hypothetical protein
MAIAVGSSGLGLELRAAAGAEVKLVTGQDEFVISGDY